jgi:hypothetical protein
VNRRLTKEEAFITIMANFHNKIAFIQKGKRGKKNIAIFEKDKDVINSLDVDMIYFDDKITKNIKKQILGNKE